MKKARILVFLAMVALMSLSVFAQTGSDFPYQLDETVTAAIMTAFGLGLMAIIQLLKMALKKIGFDNWSDLGKHLSIYLVSLLGSAGCTLFVLSDQGKLNLVRFIIYTVWAAVEANQGWKIVKELIEKNAKKT